LKIFLFTRIIRYEHKLADQLDRYDRLSEEMELLKQKCDALLNAERMEFERQLNGDLVDSIYY